MRADHPIRLLCRLFNVSSTGFYDWCQRQIQPSIRAQQDAVLKVAITEIFKDNRQSYGSPRIQVKLKQQGHCHGRNRIARLMRQEALSGRPRKRYRVHTTDSNHEQPIAPNRLAQVEPPTRLNQIWIGDITYIATREGWLYLAGIEDLYSRRIVGWSMGEHIDAKLVQAAWNMACIHRQPKPGLLFHSDRGVQYASQDYRHALDAFGAVASMSRRGNCYDNAAMESFWSTLKHELVYRCVFKTRAQARQAIFDYIETFYNRHRLHSSLNYMSPVDFENISN